MKLNFSRKEIKAFAILALAMIFLVLVNGTPFVFGDAYGYFHVGKTIAVEGYYPASATPEYYPYSGHGVGYFNGKYITSYSIGQGILWLPFLIVSSIFDSGSTFNDYYKAFNGHSFTDGLAVLLTSVAAGYIGIIFTYLLLKELGFSKKKSFLATLAVFLSIHLISYTFEQPGYSHVYEFFAYSGFLYFFIKCLSTKKSIFLYFAAAFAGLLVLIRLVDIVLIIPVILFAIYKIRNKKVLIISSIILFLFSLVLLIYNSASYGNAFTTGYSLGSGSSGFNLGFNISNLLFSDTRGLFIWSPITLLSVIGFVWYCIKSKTMFVIFLLPSVFLLFVYNFWVNWWAGVSAGQRFFIVLTPLFALGLAYLSEKFKYKLIFKSLVIILVGFALIVSALYRITPVTTLQEQFRPEMQSLTIPENEDYRVSDLFRYHLALIKNNNGISDYFGSLTDRLNGGRSILLLAIGATDPLIKIETISPQEYRFHFIPSNTAKDITVNTFVVFSSGNIAKAYVIPDNNYRIYKSAVIRCDTQLNCNSNDIELVNAQVNLEDLKFAEISYNVKVAVYAEDVRINFINRKLK